MSEESSSELPGSEAGIPTLKRKARRELSDARLAIGGARQAWNENPRTKSISSFAITDNQVERIRKEAEAAGKEIKRPEAVLDGQQEIRRTGLAKTAAATLAGALPVGAATGSLLVSYGERPSIAVSAGFGAVVASIVSGWGLLALDEHRDSSSRIAANTTEKAIRE